ncbi:MAG: hypothetical protein JXO22_00755 [Phycisphaerae bacterium]|nr:hypothetical protein [Phycisphaerae bacterium]
MTETTKPRLAWRLVRIVRRVLYGLLLLWFGWFAVARWSTLPAAPPRDLTPEEDQAQGRLDELQALLLSLQPFTSQNAQNASAWGAIPIWDAVRGQWTPDERPVLRDIVTYVTAEPQRHVLDELVKATRQRAALLPALEHIRVDPYWMVVAKDTGRFPAGVIDRRIWSEAAGALSARARYRTEQQDDLRGAVDDLRAALRLMELQSLTTIGPDSWWYGWYGIGESPLVELRCVTRERPLPPGLAHELIVLVSDELGTSLSEAVAQYCGFHIGIDRLLDPYYTDDGRGNGWLVLSHSADVLTSQISAPKVQTIPQSAFWNLFSPVFDDRATVRDKLLHMRSEIGQFDTLEFPVAERLTESLFTEYAEATPVVLDGPLWLTGMRLHKFLFASIYQTVAQRRAAVVMLALSAYRHDHDDYPESLGELVPQYLDKVPLELCARKSFSYRRMGATDYELRATEGAETPAKIPDGLYSIERAEPVHEPAGDEETSE